MTTSIKVELVTPEALLFSSDVEMVVLPGSEGDFGVLYNHAPVVSSLRSGVIVLNEGKDVTRNLFVSGGFAEVTGECCTILAEDAVDLAEVTLEDAKHQLQEAEESLKYTPDHADKTILNRRISHYKELVKILEDR